MKVNTTLCDICKKECTLDIEVWLTARKEDSSWELVYPSGRYDICIDCYKKIESFVKGGNV